MWEAWASKSRVSVSAVGKLEVLVSKRRSVLESWLKWMTSEGAHIYLDWVCKLQKYFGYVFLIHLLYLKCVIKDVCVQSGWEPSTSGKSRPFVMASLIRYPKLLVIHYILPYIKPRPASWVKCRLPKILSERQDRISGKSAYIMSYFESA